MRLLALLSLVLASLHAPASSFAGADTSVGRRAGLEAEVVREVNRIRVEHGLRPLRAAPSLRMAARTHSRSMLAAGVFGHDSPDGTSFNKRIRRFYGDRGWQTWSVGEALLASSGQDITASAIVSAWLDSPSHREVVLASSWRDVGVGAFRAAAAPGVFGGLETLVVTADFGLREGRTSSR